MTPKTDTKFKEKLTFGFKYDMKNLVNFQPTTQVWKFRSFCPKYIRFGLKNTEDLSFMILNSDAKFEFPDLVVSKMAWGIGWNFLKALKILKNGTLMGFFCPMHKMFQLENLRGIMCHDTER